MAKGFFSRFGKTEGPEGDPPTVQPSPPATPAATAQPAPETDAIVRIARDIARQALPSAPRKEAVSLRLDADVLEWFRARGPGYQTRINAVLRAYKDAAG